MASYVSQKTFFWVRLNSWTESYKIAAQLKISLSGSQTVTRKLFEFSPVAINSFENKDYLSSIIKYVILLSEHKVTSLHRSTVHENQSDFVDHQLQKKILIGRFMSYNIRNDLEQSLGNTIPLLVLTESIELLNVFTRAK